MPRAIVLLSGGQDSTTCLYWAIDRFGRGNVSTLTFDYGQRHAVELRAATRVSEIAGVPNSILPIDTFAALGGNALVDASLEIREAEGPEQDLPNTFVPGRNLILLTFAAAAAYREDLKDLVAGMAQTDYSGYPDCREQAIRALEQALRLGLAYEITIHTPLMHLDKGQTVELARSLGALEALAYSHTCYEGQEPPCGACPSCRLRAKGFLDAGIPDPLLERHGGRRVAR